MEASMEGESKRLMCGAKCDQGGPNTTTAPTKSLGGEGRDGVQCPDEAVVKD